MRIHRLRSLLAALCRGRACLMLALAVVLALGMHSAGAQAQAVTAGSPAAAANVKSGDAWFDSVRKPNWNVTDKVTLDLEMTRGTYLELAEADRSHIVGERIEGVGRVLSIVVVALGALAGYIRLDEFTKGYYTGRLRLLAIAIVTAASFALANV